MPFIIGGLIAAGGSLIGGALGGRAAKSAAQTQADAATQAAQMQSRQYGQTRQDLAPWMQGGQAALSELEMLLGLPGSAAATGQNATAPNRSQFTQTTNTPGGRWLNSGNGRNSSQQWVPDGGTSQTTFDQAGFDAAMQAYTSQNNATQMNKIGRQSDPRYGSLMRPFGQQQFQESPAYQFNLEQGMDAINKATRARGTNYAPSTLQDIGKYAQGMASNEFLNAYNMYNQDQGNQYSRLMGLSQSGQNAGAQFGAYGNQSANAAGGYMTDAGAASAAGTMGQANAYAGGFGGALNSMLQMNALRGMQAPSYAPQGVNFNPANQQQMQEMLGPWA